MSDTPKAIATLVLFGFDLYVYPLSDVYRTLRIKRNVSKGEAMLSFSPERGIWFSNRSLWPPHVYERVAWEDYTKELGRLTPANIEWLVNPTWGDLED
jgi:hypothetical protein